MIERIIKEFSTNAVAIGFFILGLVFLSPALLSKGRDTSGMTIGILIISASIVGFILNRRKVNSTVQNPEPKVPVIDRTKIKESWAEKKSEKILLYNTKSYFWIAAVFTIIPVIYMTWKNSRYYDLELRTKLRKFSVIFLIFYVAIILFGSKLYPDDLLIGFIIWLFIIAPYFQYTNVHEYPVYKKMIESNTARARASVAPVVIGIIILSMYFTLIYNSATGPLAEARQRACINFHGQWVLNPKPHCINAQVK